MSGQNLFWFHCGRCGSLFQSIPGELDNRLCHKCGFDPCHGLAESPVEPAPVPAPPAEAGPKEHRGKRSVKRRKPSYFMIKLILGWSVVLAMIIFGARKMWPSQPVTETRPTQAPAVTTDAEDMELLNQAGPKCVQALAGFLSAGGPEQRNQFVLTPVATASRMARFYSLNPLTNVDPQTISLEKSGILRAPDGKRIETLWKSQDGRSFDAVFREENGEWKLDWDHFARYSDYPWSLFLAGSGAPEGEFRLLARERLAEERKGEDTISVVLYAPRFGHPSTTGFQSPEFLVSRHKPEGRMLDAAFRLARSGKAIFDSTIPAGNPDGMIRLRVKVKRTEVNMERRFEITGVSACHWYSIADPGVNPEKAETKPAER